MGFNTPYHENYQQATISNPECYCLLACDAVISLQMFTDVSEEPAVSSCAKTSDNFGNDYNAQRTSLWNVTSCSLVHNYKYFRRIC